MVDVYLSFSYTVLSKRCSTVLINKFNVFLIFSPINNSPNWEIIYTNIPYSKQNTVLGYKTRHILALFTSS